MRDRETGTIWQHATGEAVVGPLAGKALVPLGSVLTTWSAWKAKHPHTQLAIDDQPFGLIPKRRLEGLLRVTSLLKTPGLLPHDTRLPAHEEIVGVALRGESRAYPLSALRRLGQIEDELSGIPIALTYESESDRVRVVTPPSVQGSVRLERQWWLGWSEFHPGGSVWKPTGAGVERSHA